MIGMDSNHCQVVSESLAGDRAVDEQTFVSLAVLAERLEGLKRASRAFAGVEFSQHVEKLKDSSPAVAVG